MKVTFYLLLVTLFLSISSCKKDTCNGVVCSNGGTCNEGVCECTAGWSGATCETSTDPCYNITCNTNGTCDNGTCNCFPHFSGADCSIQETPSYIYIKRLVVVKFHPANQSNALWDAGSSADIYPIIRQGNTEIYNGMPWRKNDANYDTWYDFTQDSIAITDISDPNFKMELWDYDDGINDEYMHGFNFTPYTGTNGFPGSITLTDTAFYFNKFEFRVYLNYVW